MAEESRWLRDAEQECAGIVAAGRWRELRPFDAAGPTGTLADGRTVVSFASNDYLGLSQHPTVKAAAHDATDRWGTGAGASRLVVGSRSVHHDLETALADWRSTESALLFPTGYAANLGVMSAFGSTACRIFSDELNHASIIDGARLARADVNVYRHLDTEHLDSLLSAQDDLRAIVVSDLVFSMDGDVAPVRRLIDICARHGALLVLDEAHAVLGPELNVDDLAATDILRVGTLSKSLGSLGGFVAGDHRLIELLLNLARPFIFTTAPTPADSAAALAALEVYRSSEGTRRREILRDHISRLAPGWASPIVPFVVGEERDAVLASAALLEQGVLVPAIRPPTVAPGTSRLRVALSSQHDAGEVERLAGLLADLGLTAATAPIEVGDGGG